MGLIELPPPGQDPSDPYPAAGAGRRALAWIGAGVLVLVLVAVAVLNQDRASQANRGLSNPALPSTAPT